MVKVSVIMPVYNAEDYVEKACMSVYNQTLKDVELICVNDGSTDNSLNIINRLSREFDFIKVFSQENQGSGQARNYGIDQATGEYIAFLDADDMFLDTDALEKMYFYGFKNDADMVGANLRRIKLDGSLDMGYDYQNTDFKYFGQKDVILPIEYGIPFAFYRNIFKKEMLDKFDIRFPDLSRGQDPIFLANILTHVKEIYVVKSDLYGYNNSVSGGVNKKINTYQKKRDYIQHFKDTMDILKANEFDSAYAGYQKEFVNFLIFEDNLLDDELNEIVPEVFGDINDYFDKDDYGYYYVDMKYQKANEEVNEELNDFRAIKEHLFEESLINDNFIDPEYLREYLSLVSDNPDKKSDIEKLSFEALKNVETNVKDDYEFLKGNIRDIEKEINTLNKSNEAILNSDSWKFTKFLRTLKHFYKD